MSIDFERDGEHHVMTLDCDKCGEEQVLQAADWRDGIDLAKAAGWQIKKVGPDKYDWEHYCRACKGEQ